MLNEITFHIDTVHIVVTIVIFLLTFAFITTETMPNAIAASLGAFLLIAFHILSQEEALETIDFDTIGLLCGMMITVAVMRKSGIFEYIAIKGIKITKGNPWRILVTMSIVTAILSAFLDNVTTVLIIVPLTFALADSIKIDPTPILISEILFSNIGGAATLIGDPPNIMIGGETGLDFMAFITHNTPVIILVSIATIYLLKLIYYKKLNAIETDSEVINGFDETKAITNKRFFWTSLILFALIVLAFTTHNLHHISLASIALGGGFMMMMVTKQEPEEILKEVEWGTLFFFIGLFIIIGGLEKTGSIGFLAEKMVKISGGKVEIASQMILWLSALATTFINSIPYTATMISVIADMSKMTTENIEPLWWALSLGACLGGNGTLIGAAANIIVAGFTQKSAYPIRFKDYLKIGLPLMLVSIAITSIYFYVRYSVLRI